MDSWFLWFYTLFSIRVVGWLYGFSSLFTLAKSLKFQHCGWKKILILLQNWKAWLRSQAFNMGNPDLGVLSCLLLSQMFLHLFSPMARTSTWAVGWGSLFSSWWLCSWFAVERSQDHHWFSDGGKPRGCRSSAEVSPAVLYQFLRLVTAGDQEDYRCGVAWRHTGSRDDSWDRGAQYLLTIE